MNNFWTHKWCKTLIINTSSFYSRSIRGFASIPNFTTAKSMLHKNNIATFAQIKLFFQLKRIKRLLPWFNEQDFMEGAKLGLEAIVKSATMGNISQLQNYLTPFAFTRITLLEDQEKTTATKSFSTPLISILNCKLQSAKYQPSDHLLLDVHYIYSLEEGSHETEKKKPTGVLYSVLYRWKGIEEESPSKVNWKLDSTLVLDQVLFRPD